MSLHTSLMGSARTVLLTVHGTDGVSFTPAGSDDAQLVTVIIGPESTDLLEELADRTNLRARTVQVDVQQVPNRERGGVFQLPIGGGQTEPWTIHRQLAEDGGMARLLVVCPQRVGSGNRRLPPGLQ